MNRPPMMPIVAWGEVKAALGRGGKAYYVDEQQFWAVVVVEPTPMQCQLLKSSARAEQPEVAEYFPPQDAEDFEANYQPTMLEGHPNG